MAARRTRLQRLRALTARMAAVQGAGFVNNGEELDALVDMAMEKDMTELQERMLAAEEHKSKSFTSPSDIQRRMRIAMQGVRLWRTSSLGDVGDDSCECSGSDDNGDATAAGRSQAMGAGLAGRPQQPADGPSCGSGQQAPTVTGRQPRLTSGGDSCGSTTEGWTAASGGSSMSEHSQLPRGGEDTWALGPEFALLMSSAAAGLDGHGLELHGGRTPDPTAGHSGLLAGGGGSFASLSATGSLLRALPSQRLGSRRFLHMQSKNCSGAAGQQLDPLSAEQQLRRAGLLGDADPLNASSMPGARHGVTESLLSLDDAAGVRLVAMAGGSSSMSSHSTLSAAGGASVQSGGSLQRLLSRSGSSFTAQQRLARQAMLRDAAAGVACEPEGSRGAGSLQPWPGAYQHGWRHHL
ncbi:hypothetical protein HXX76_000657 [Chlamydomonas incerta]|uniref:Uncharacterized protein n=1 Tax=Chlamydomonas incerta TaxID=51695 RepID=A0A835WFB3_CHLIN|nr:hypothetical protein HXX76_000657 [Chlamydomonas incerta]|eukprot:KAG2446055.1 hypothetical protein HXX76_000657 [Chlamydomonas incerta]